MNEIIAKNLLLGKICKHCNSASSLAVRRNVNKSSNFEKITGYKIEDIHESAYLFSDGKKSSEDTLFHCWGYNKPLPEEITCENYETCEDLSDGYDDLPYE